MVNKRDLLPSEDYDRLIQQLANGIDNFQDVPMHYVCQVCLLCAGTGMRVSDVCKFTRKQIQMLLDLGSFAFRVQKSGSLGIVIWYGEMEMLEKILNNWVDFKCSRASLYRLIDKFLQNNAISKRKGIKFHEFRFKVAGRLYNAMKTQEDVQLLLDHKSKKITKHYIAQELYNMFKEGEQNSTI